MPVQALFGLSVLLSFVAFGIIASFTSCRSSGRSIGKMPFFLW